MRWLQRNTGNLTLAAGSIVLCLFASETFLWVAGYEYTPLAIEVNNPDDARPFHIFEDHYFVHDPELIWRPKKNYAVFNSHGFRGPELEPDKPAGAFRIFAVGDSNTLGWAEDDGANWPLYLGELLRLHSNRFELVNAGVWGYSSFQGMKRLRQVLEYEPDMLLVSFGANDAHQVTLSDREFVEQRPVTGLDLALMRFRTGQLLLAFLNRSPAADPDRLRPRVSLDSYRANLNAIIDAARQRNAQVVLLTRPYVREVNRRMYWKHFVHEYNAATVEVAVERGVAVVDIYSFFKDKEEFFADTSHFTEQGHRLAASIILDEIATLLPISQPGRP